MPSVLYLSAFIPIVANLALFPELTAHKAVSDKLGPNLIFRGACKNTSYAKQYSCMGDLKLVSMTALDESSNSNIIFLNKLVI